MLGKNDPIWAFSNILRYVQSEKIRVEKKQITGSTLRNSIKSIKMFCEISDLSIPWKKISRGLPRGRRYADDRAPTIEEIRRILKYPDRRIKPIGTYRFLLWIQIRFLGLFEMAKCLSDYEEQSSYSREISRLWRRRR